MDRLMKNLLLLKLLGDMEENTMDKLKEEFDEETSDLITEYEIKLLAVLFVLLRYEKKDPGHSHLAIILDVCTGLNKMLMAHILHLLDEFSIIELNEDNSEIKLNLNNLLVQALLESEEIQEVFDELFKDNRSDASDLFDLFAEIFNVDDSSDLESDDDTECEKCSLEDIFKTLGGI